MVFNYGINDANMYPMLYVFHAGFYSGDIQTGDNFTFSAETTMRKGDLMGYFKTELMASNQNFTRHNFGIK